MDSFTERSLCYTKSKRVRSMSYTAKVRRLVSWTVALFGVVGGCNRRTVLGMIDSDAMTTSSDGTGRDVRKWKMWSCDDLTPDLCDDLVLSTGQVPIQDGLFVTYWKYSRASSSPPVAGQRNIDDTKLPIIVVHGGPGVPHNYMLPFKQQACRGRDVFFYDQAGCGMSPIPTNRTASDYPFLLDPQYYATIELPTLVKFWGLKSYHVVANSWGTLLAQYFELNARPDGLVSLVLTGPYSDSDLYIRSQWDPDVGNLGSLPPYVQQRIQSLEAAGAYQSDEYLALNDALTGFFTCRTVPAPDCLDAAESGMNHWIYVSMQGASEFTAGGVLAHFNTTPRLPTVRVPVLLASGRYDTMRPPVVDAMYRTIPTVEWVVLNHSGHMSMIDDAGKMNDIVEDFFKRVELAHYSDGLGEFVPKPGACGPVGCHSKYYYDGGGSSSSSSTSEEPVHSEDDIVSDNDDRLPMWIVVVMSFVVGLLSPNVMSWLSSWSYCKGKLSGYEPVESEVATML